MATSIDYPAHRLSQPLVPGYGIKPQDAVARTDMESGAARHRRRWIKPPAAYSATFLFSRYELAIFEGWHLNDIDEGAAWFNIDLLSGVGMASCEARFKWPYEAAPRNSSELANAENWTVTATLEIRDRPILDAGMTAILLDSDLDDLVAAIDASIAANGGLPRTPYYWQWN